MHSVAVTVFIFTVSTVSTVTAVGHEYAGTRFQHLFTFYFIRTMLPSELCERCAFAVKKCGAIWLTGTQLAALSGVVKEY